MKRLAILVVLVSVLTGCGGLRGMRTVPAGQTVNTTPPPGKVAVVFMRPQAPGHTASVFEVKKDTNVFVGHVLTGTKVLYITDPGTTRFLVSGQGGDLMDAQLEAGRTYYVLVAPGFSSAYSLRPVTKADNASFRNWFNACGWIEMGEEPQRWARQHAQQIEARRQAITPKWEAKPDRPTLRAGDYR